MKIRDYTAAIGNFFADLYGQIFHKRNIIIVSEHKVKHVPVSGRLQLLTLFLGVTGICWASYSTGSYYAVNHAFEEQSRTLKSVVGDKVDSNFSPIASEEVLTPMAQSKVAIASTSGNVALFARIVELEKLLHASEESKKDFIEKVEEKTSKNISSFENLIEKTGLDLDSLKSHAAGSVPEEKAVNSKDRQGGPYIPEVLTDTSNRETAVISKLDELSKLREIVQNLPVRMPVYDYQEMSGFGRRIDPFTGSLAFHAGVDLAGPENANIFATADGVVSFSGRQGAYGNMVELDHGFNITTRYGHLSQILVEEGTRVKKGQIIGIQGSTGRSTGNHLHYEVRYNNQPLDPRNFLNAGRYVSQKG